MKTWTILLALLACGDPTGPTPPPPPPLPLAQFVDVGFWQCPDSAQRYQDCTTEVSDTVYVNTIYLVVPRWQNAPYLGGMVAWQRVLNTECPNYNASSNECYVFGTWGPFEAQVDSVLEHPLLVGFTEYGVAYTIRFALLAGVDGPILAKTERIFPPAAVRVLMKIGRIWGTHELVADISSRAGGRVP